MVSISVYEADFLRNSLLVVVDHVLDLDGALADDVQAGFGAGAAHYYLVGLQDALYELQGDVVLEGFRKVCEEEQTFLYDFGICLLEDF